MGICAWTVLACAPSPPAAAPAEPTLVLVNGRVWTGDPSRPWAQALAVRGETIVAVGDDAEIEAEAGAAKIIDAEGRLVTPGFIDAHVHLVSAGFQLAAVDLRDAASRQELADRLRSYAEGVPAGAWITGGNWDHSLWGGELPTREWIDEATPANPVWIRRLDGHMGLANSLALAAAGVSRATADVPGGAIVRDARGEPTGVLKDNAKALVEAAVPEPSPETQDRALEAAMRYLGERGVTSVDSMGTWSDLETFARARKRGALRTRVYAAVPLDTWRRLEAAIDARTYGGDDGRGDTWLRIGALKGYVDGSLGSRTAAMIEPFDDAPGGTGLLVNTPEDLYAWTSGADRAGLQVLVHAIGDRANRLILDIYERVARENGARDRRFRVEHAQHLTAADVPRFGALGVIPSMQPYHLMDDGRWAEPLIGPERAKTTYAFRSLLESGARLAFGSDWPVAPPTPIEGIYAAVTRRTLDDRHPRGWVPEQKITVEEALRAYTSGGAFASFEEDRKGVLAPGRLADFVVLDRDLFEIPPDAIRDVGVALTVVGGEVVFRAPGD